MENSILGKSKHWGRVVIGGNCESGNIWVQQVVIAGGGGNTSGTRHFNLLPLC